MLEYVSLMHLKALYQHISNIFNSPPNQTATEGIDESKIISVFLKMFPDTLNNPWFSQMFSAITEVFLITSADHFLARYPNSKVFKVKIQSNQFHISELLLHLSAISSTTIFVVSKTPWYSGGYQQDGPRHVRRPLLGQVTQQQSVESLNSE
jgi:hypothetical protein